MKKLSILLTTLFITFFIGYLAADDPVAIVIKASGGVSIKNEETGKSVEAKRGTKLADGDKITTNKTGRVAIKFLDDNSLLRVRPNSTCTVNTKKENQSVAKNIFVEVGTIFSKITRQRSPYRVTTPTSVASVKGTIFWTIQEFKGATTYFGEEGVIEIENEAGTALLNKGEKGYVSSQNSKPIVTKTKPGEKPSLDGDDDTPDEFEFEFENDRGQNKLLKFKAEKE